jgi:hypothetical protein
MYLNRVAAVVILTFGVVGVASCAPGAYGVWLVGSRLERANNRFFDAIDRGLGVVQDRLPVVRQRVRDSKVTTAEMTEVVQEWSAKETRDRILSRLEIERRAERISGHLRSVDLRLEATTETVHNVRQVLELAQNLGAGVDPASTDAVLEVIASLRSTVHEAEQSIDGVRQFATSSGGESAKDRLSRVAKLLARILLTLSEVDGWLDDQAARLSEVRADARQLKSTTNNYLVMGSFACYGLLLWSAAGQAALSGRGWNLYRRSRSPAGRSEG